MVLGSDYFADWKCAMDDLQTVLLFTSVMKKDHQHHTHGEDTEQGQHSLPLPLPFIVTATEAVAGEEVKRRKKKQRLRSRNVVVDDWLEQEDGHDAFADLEDFLVY
jgi:hypothetical protein